MTDIKQLKSVRWGVRAVLILGVAASITGNVLHANDTFIAQAIAAWAPLALLLTIELIARVPVYRRGLAAVRWLVTAVIAAIAAWVSYDHQVAVAKLYGETGTSPYLLPLSVDGLIVVASICLVELGGRIRTALEENGESNAEGQPVQGGRRVLEEAAGDGRGEAAPGLREEGHEEEVAAVEGVNLTPSRKPHPTAKERVEKAHKRTPAATHAQLAERLKLTPSTVKRYRPKPPDETPLNGHDLRAEVKS